MSRPRIPRPARGPPCPRRIPENREEVGTLRIGIVGLGGISRAHGDAIETLPNVEIVAAADLLEAPRRAFGDRYEVPRAVPNTAAASTAATA